MERRVHPFCTRSNEKMIRDVVPYCPGCMRRGRWHFEAFYSAYTDSHEVEVMCQYPGCGYRRSRTIRNIDRFFSKYRAAGYEYRLVADDILSDLRAKEATLRPDHYCEYTPEAMVR